MHQLATLYTSFSAANGEVLPYTTIPDFETIGSATRSLSGAGTIMYLPLLMNARDVLHWNAYSQLNTDWIERSRAFQHDHGEEHHGTFQHDEHGEGEEEHYRKRDLEEEHHDEEHHEGYDREEAHEEGNNDDIGHEEGNHEEEGNEEEQHHDEDHHEGNVAEEEVHEEGNHDEEGGYDEEGHLHEGEEHEEGHHDEEHHEKKITKEISPFVYQFEHNSATEISSTITIPASPIWQMYVKLRPPNEHPLTTRQYSHSRYFGSNQLQFCRRRKSCHLVPLR